MAKDARGDLPDRLYVKRDDSGEDTAGEEELIASEYESDFDDDDRLGLL